MLGEAASPCLSEFAVEELVDWDVICSYAVGLLKCLVETSDLAKVILEWKGVEVVPIGSLSCSKTSLRLLHRC